MTPPEPDLGLHVLGAVVNQEHDGLAAMHQRSQGLAAALEVAGSAQGLKLVGEARGLACAQAILLAIVIALISLVQFKLMGTDVEY